MRQLRLEPALDEVLAALSREAAGRGAPPGVEAALRQAFRNRRAARRRSRWVAGAIAAGALLLVSLGLLRQGPPPRAAVWTIEEDFLPVVRGEALDPGEGVRLVRARVPRAALTSFGLPVNAELAGEGIQADLVVGQDGTLRAIRLVH